MLRRLRAIVAELLRRDTLDQAMKDEFALHVDLFTEDLVRRGVARDDAAREARLAFGNMTVVTENGRSAKGIAWLDTLSQDIRFTARTLRKNLGFTAVAVLSLGFGIGAATTMFSVIDTLDFRALPYLGGDRLVSLQQLAPSNAPVCPRCGGPTSRATARDWLAQARSYETAVVTDQATFEWEHDDIEETPVAGATTPGLLRFFGIQPLIGRDILDTDTLPGAEPVVVLTYEFWEKRFQRDPRIVGMQLRGQIENAPAGAQMVTVVGVAPKDFRILPYIKLWTAMSLRSPSRRAGNATVFARLKPGVSIASAAAELQALTSRIAEAYPVEFRDSGATVALLREEFAWGAGAARGVLFGVTMAVLLVAVLNVTGLLFNRAGARRAEFAMRAALGAGRSRLFRQLLVEGSCIGIFGGLIGVAFAFGGVAVAGSWFKLEENGFDVSVDARMLAFVSLLSLIAGAAAAVAPALRTSRMDAAASMRPRVTGGSREARASRGASVLIAAQVALAFTLLSVAALLSHDFLELRYLDLGYDPQGVFTTYLRGPRGQAPDLIAWKSVVTETRARAAGIRGVESATLLYQSAVHPAIVRPDVATDPSMREPRLQAVAPDFFAAWKNPLLLGRAFTSGDREGTILVAMVTKSAAAAFWPGQNPLGRRVFVGDSASAGEWLTVVGVTQDIETGVYALRHSPVVYRPLAQARLYHPAVQLAVRVAGDRPETLAAVESVVRQAIGRHSDPLENEDERLGTRWRTRRFNAIALDVFATFGLLLAAMGIYGSIAFSVTQRTREIGIRVALGAARSNVLALIARRGIVVTAVGATVGVALSLAVTRVFRSLVTAASVTNPWIVVLSVFVIVVVSLIATFIPARRATVVSPVIALRAE